MHLNIEFVLCLWNKVASVTLKSFSNNKPAAYEAVGRATKPCPGQVLRHTKMEITFENGPSTIRRERSTNCHSFRLNPCVLWYLLGPINK